MVDTQRAGDVPRDRRVSQPGLAVGAREWRWGDGLRPDLPEAAIDTDADIGRLRRRYRLERTVHFAFAIVAVTFVLLCLGMIGLWIYAMVTGAGGYCCGPE